MGGWRLLRTKPFNLFLYDILFIDEWHLSPISSTKQSTVSTGSKVILRLTRKSM